MRPAWWFGVAWFVSGSACDDKSTRVDDVSFGDAGPSDAAWEQSARDAAREQPARDAALDPVEAAVMDAALVQLSIGPREGAEDDDVATPTGPALALDSGAPVAEVFTWMQHAAFAEQPGRGDLVVLSAAGGDRAASLLAAGSFHSAQTLSLGDAPAAADYAVAATIIGHAEVVWFEGGDQAKYVRWSGSPLMTAVQGVYDRGGVIGGSSAGMIILGSAVNDALLTISENLTTARLLADPFDADLHFTRDLFRFSPLAGTITDPHFSSQDRMGRLVTFMARQVEGPAGYRGIAVDNGIALVIAAGKAHRVGTGEGSAYVVHGGVPERLLAGQTLRYAGLHVRRLASPEHMFDLTRACGTDLGYELTVDGASASPYSTDPYASGVLESDCPVP